MLVKPFFPYATGDPAPSTADGWGGAAAAHCVQPHLQPTRPRQGSGRAERKCALAHP